MPDGGFVVMAIVNRTPDSFYDRGATYELAAAVERVHRVVAEGADMVDVGGVKAAPGEEVDAAEEIRRTADLVAAIRSTVRRTSSAGETYSPGAALTPPTSTMSAPSATTCPTRSTAASSS